MIPGNVYSSYKKQAVTTMTPIEIVIKLYDECERQMNRGLFFMEKKDIENTNTSLMKAMEIVGALRSVLDLDIAIGRDLDALYEYFAHELIEANIKKDTEKVKALLPMVADLKDAFLQISRMPKEQIHMQAMQNSASAVAM
ncbi:MAG: flagellar export chaperone FliS [Oscillospiraceae bacterium]|nr:flagellar export chaperone FliS [Oscillospiraceae bacterium]